MKREKVIEYYNQYIDEVLKVYIQKYSEVRWLTPSKLTLRSSKGRIPWGEKVTDSYIYESRNDKTLLGRDILKNGTYYPVFITHDNAVMMGVHRVESLQQLRSDRELMCVVINDKHFDKTRTDKPKYEFRNPVELEDTEYMRVPTCAEIPKDARIDEYIIFKANKKKFRSGDEYATFETNNYRDMMDILKIVPHWIKDYFYEQQQNGIRIQARECINDKGAFEKWISKENTKVI